LDLQHRQRKGERGEEGQHGGWQRGKRMGTEVTCSEATAPGSSLSSSLPLPLFPFCPPLFPALFEFSRPPLPLPTAPLSPSSPLFASLYAAPPHLSPLIFVGVVSPTLPFPSTIWILIPPVLTTSARHNTHHTATATPPLHLQQPAPKPSIIPSDSDSQHSVMYLCEFPESVR
jgi:hypothetical protein